MKKLKEKMVSEDLINKHYLSYYNVEYNPFKKMLNFKFDCPRPILKVQIYKEKGKDSFTSILVDNGNLFDPTYEVLLRSENKIEGKLPHFALPYSQINSDKQKIITNLFLDLDEDLKKHLSEVILDEDGTLMAIFSHRGAPTSAFLGKDQWKLKIDKLTRVMKFLKKKQRIPSIVNLTSSKKVVVKFSDKI